MSVLKIKDEKGRWIGIPSIKGADGAVSHHAESHEKGGFDEITPESIGAATEEAVAEADNKATTANTKANQAYSLAETAANYATSALGTSGTAQATADTAKSRADEAYAKAEEAKTIANSKAPAYTYGTDDISAGSTSPYATGTLHFVYE